MDTLYDRGRRWAATSFRNLRGEDASFDQLYSLQRIELTDTLRKNHGKDESWQLLIRLKMAGLVPAKKSASGPSINVTTAKESDPSAGDSAFCFPPVCLHN
jgi:hypothetical protein